MTVPQGWGCSDACTMYSNAELLLLLPQTELAGPAARGGLLSHH